jgi:hypothetical protein
MAQLRKEFFFVPLKCEFQEFSSNFSVYNNRRFKYIWLACILAFREVRHRVLQVRKALPGIFLCIFSSLTCLKIPVFSKPDLLRWKVPARLYWDILTSWRYLSLFLKSEKIPAVLHIGKGPEYRPFSYTLPIVCLSVPSILVKQLFLHLHFADLK